MHLGETAVAPLPQLRVTHGAKEVRNFLLLVFVSGSYFQAVDLLQNFSLLVEQLLHGDAFFFFVELSRILNLLGFVQTPGLELIEQYVEVFALLRVQSTLDFDFPFVLFLDTQLFLAPHKLGILVVSEFPQLVSPPAGEPGPDAALNVESRLLTLLGPHTATEIVFIRPNNLVFPGVHEETSVLAITAEADVHLNAHLSHHDRRLRFVLVRLHHSLISFRVLLEPLVGLRKGMVIHITRLVVAIAAEVRLRALCLLNLDVDALDLFEVS